MLLKEKDLLKHHTLYLIEVLKTSPFITSSNNSKKFHVTINNLYHPTKEIIWTLRILYVKLYYRRQILSK